MRGIYGLFFAGIIMMGCSDMDKSAGNTTVAQGNYLDSVSCDSCRRMLISSTNINIALKSTLSKEDGLNNDTLLIKLYHRNESEPGNYFEAADGFINIDMKKKKVFLVNIAEEKLEEVTCDKAILNHYITKCLSTQQPTAKR